MQETRAAEAQPIDVDAIMADIRESIRTRGYKPSQLSFRDITAANEMTEERIAKLAERYDSFSHARHLEYMEDCCDIDYIKPIKGNKLKVIVKKVIRKLISPAIMPIIEDINAFHSASLEAGLQSFFYIYEARRENERLRERITELEKRLAAANGENSDGTAEDAAGHGGSAE